MTKKGWFLPAFLYVFRHLMREAGTGFDAIPGDVWGEEDAFGVLGVEVGMVQGDGLLLINVDADAGDAFFVDGADQVRFHGDTAAAGVYEEGGRFHLAKSLVVNESRRPLVVGGVDADDVGGGQQFVQGDTGIVFAVRGSGSGVVDDLHAEGRADGGDFPADGAHAHDAEGFPADFGEGVLRIDMDTAGAVAAVARVGVIMEREAGEGQDVHPGGLGDGLRRIAGDVPDDDAPLAAQFDVDVVDAGPGFAHQFQFRAGVQEGLVHDDFVEEDHIGIRRADAGLFGRGGGIADEFAQGGDLRHRGVAHRGGVQENDFHDESVLIQI